MKKVVLLFFLATVVINVNAQREEENEEKKGGFRKDNLFTGGSLSLGFSNRSFQAGINPTFGYSIAPWIDAGIVVNYNYASFQDPYRNGFDDKLRQSTYGGGGFIKVYPANFLFIQGQLEHNYTTQKYIPGNGTETSSVKVDASSLLLGAGYASGRYPESGRPFFYMALLFDVMNNQYSPYTDGTGRIIPILRAGVQVPLFNGGPGGRNDRGDYR